MRIHLTNAAAITLIEPADFRRLDVLVDPQPQDRLDRLIHRIGKRDGDDHIRLNPAILRFLSGHAGDETWEQGFAAMLAYAAKSGWVDDQGLVRAHLTRAETDPVVTTDQFRAAMRALPAGVCAIAGRDGDAVCGMIVSSLTSISAEPPLVGFFVNETASMLAPLLAQGRFSANVLGQDHRAVVDCFMKAPQGAARFAVGDWRIEDGRLPVLADALASIECDIIHTQALGTHRMIVGKVRAAQCHAAAPMVNFNAGTHGLAQVAAE